MKTKLLTYAKTSLLHDLRAGFITSVVALPLAIAFAIASGAAPVMGLYTAIIAGVLGSAVGGSRFSITGPTGAMTVIVLSTVHKYGVAGLLLTGFLAGVMQILFGAFRLGRFVQYIPLPVVSGFTAGIGAIIFLGQVPNALGLSLPSHEFIGATVLDIVNHLGSANLTAIGITAGTLALLVFLPRLLARAKFFRNVPASLPPLVLSVAAVYFLGLAVPQVGDIPRGLPGVQPFAISFDLVRQVLPAAFTIALLGAIEALLCAVVCDGMTGTKHKANKELVAQGVANVVMPFFGGIPATAAIARSAVNIREGAKTRAAGIIHALFLLSYMLFLGPVVRFVPKGFLAGVLMFVSSKMVNVGEFKTIARISRADFLVLGATMALTVLTDLVFAVEVGMVLSVFLLFVHFANSADISTSKDYQQTSEINAALASHPTLRDKVGVYTVNGPFFFGAMSVFEKKLNEHMQMAKPVIILRMKEVPFIDSTGVVRLKEFIHRRIKAKGAVLISGLQPWVRDKLQADAEFRKLIPGEHLFARTKEALAYAERLVAESRPKDAAKSLQKTLELA